MTVLDYDHRLNVHKHADEKERDRSNSSKGENVNEQEEGSLSAYNDDNIFFLFYSSVCYLPCPLNPEFTDIPTIACYTNNE